MIHNKENVNNRKLLNMRREYWGVRAFGWAFLAPYWSGLTYMLSIILATYGLDLGAFRFALYLVVGYLVFVVTRNAYEDYPVCMYTSLYSAWAWFALLSVTLSGMVTFGDMAIIVSITILPLLWAARSATSQ